VPHVLLKTNSIIQESKNPEVKNTTHLLF